METCVYCIVFLNTNEENVWSGIIDDLTKTELIFSVAKMSNLYFVKSNLHIFELKKQIQNIADNQQFVIMHRDLNDMKDQSSTQVVMDLKKPEPKKILKEKNTINIDDILDKICEYGIDSLTIEEKNILDNLK